MGTDEGLRGAGWRPGGSFQGGRRFFRKLGLRAPIPHDWPGGGVASARACKIARGQCNERLGGALEALRPSDLEHKELSAQEAGIGRGPGGSGKAVRIALEAVSIRLAWPHNPGNGARGEGAHQRVRLVREHKNKRRQHLPRRAIRGGASERGMRKERGRRQKPYPFEGTSARAHTNRGLTLKLQTPLASPSQRVKASATFTLKLVIGEEEEGASAPLDADAMQKVKMLEPRRRKRRHLTQTPTVSWSRQPLRASHFPFRASPLPRWGAASESFKNDS